MIITLNSFSAFADGFTCTNIDGDLKVSVYNKIDPLDGTRSPAVMIVSNPAIQSRRKTIAKFSEENRTLDTSHTTADYLVFTGDVDLRFSDSNRKGEYLFGTRLGEVDFIQLNVDFTYGDNLMSGDKTSGSIVVMKRDGKAIVRPAVCTRYLRNEQL